MCFAMWQGCRNSPKVPIYLTECYKLVYNSCCCMKQGRGGGGRAQQIQTLKMHGRCRDTASDLKNIQVKMAN